MVIPRAGHNIKQTLAGRFKDRPNLVGLSLEELRAIAEGMGERPYRGDQIFKWIYRRNAVDFHSMTDLGKSFRERLSDSYRIDLPRPITKKTSLDGTKKYLLALEDGNLIEAILIPANDHYTVCVSTQVGCRMGCTFCATALAGFRRNLTAGEIVGQILAIKRANPGTRITNVVFMGMGEPLDNYDATMKAANLLINPEGMALSQRKITISTSGVVPAIERIGKDLKVNLAVSLNAPDDNTRNRLMPLNRKWPLRMLLAALTGFPLKRGRKITIEYVVIKDVNCSDEDARKLARLLRNLQVKINLIPFNEYPGIPFSKPEIGEIESFQKILIDEGFTAIIRKSMGSDIFAACGQLRGEKEVEKK